MLSVLPKKFRAQSLLAGNLLTIKTLAVSIFAVSLLAGCASAAPATSTSGSLLPPAGSPSYPPAGEVSPLPIQELPTPESQPAAASAPTQVFTATPPSSRKEVKAGLEATDPTTVQLASGEVQLVEFFAFW
ncbi:MAG TPA: hypothetical protein VN363_07075 [Anaerolineales bacterium]|nr:hypothetical protein [Anaerolineales bacterium]